MQYLKSGKEKCGGFAMLEIIIALVLVLLLTIGTILYKNPKTQKNILETGIDAENQALQLKTQMEKEDAKNQAIINQLDGQLLSR